ncbi:MAG: DUF814 domain-containing protein [Candidatus Aenigmarchaeota archaeon]|nr:DUF814 domain-containing protein [Candidatus Aenigmarchaeota archaeon]
MIEVEIDIRKNARQNAEKYFQESKKAKAKIATAEAALAKTLKQIENMKAGAAVSEIKKSVLPQKRRPRGKWYESFRWMFTTEGFLVIAGRDAKQNEIIFAKRIEPTDIVLHAEITGAPLTVIKAEGKTITPLAIREAAEFAAAYSRAWAAGLGGVDVYWVRPEQVSKTAPAGEFLPKGAFMIRGTKNYLKKMELKVAIGIKFETDKEGKRAAKLIYGNVQAVNKHAKYFVTIQPGDMPQARLAAEIRRQILIKALPDDKVLIEQIPIDEIQRAIPAGNGSIVS